MVPYRQFFNLKRSVFVMIMEIPVGLRTPRRVFWRRQWHPTPVLLPGKSHGWRSLVGCSSWGR